jgi:lysophospholipase L1-like esterase
MQVLYVRPRYIKRLLYGGAILAVVVMGGGAMWARLPWPGVSALAAGWTAPSNADFRRVGDLSAIQNEPDFLNNIDCTAITYRMSGSHTMQTGCFTPTAFGMLDGDSETVIYNGTDEGVRLETSVPDEILEPWPDALNLISFEPISTGGTYLGLFKNVPPARPGYNGLGEVTSEQITRPPDMFVNDPSGQHLVVNPQTAAFSAGGGWLVVEDYNNSFVRINLATMDLTAFAPAFNNPIVQDSRVAVSPDGRFVAIENAHNTTFKVYDLSTCTGGQHDLAAQSCRSYDYWATAHQRIGGLQSIRHLQFVNDDLLSFEATSSSPAASGNYELSPTGNISSLTDYLSLGDSYTSGEGAFDYVAGTDTGDNKCHLSAHSYPLLLTRDSFGGAGGHSVACSGAIINDIGSLSGDYRGQVRGGSSYDDLASSGRLGGILADFSPGQISQRRFVRHYQPRVVSVSIGGNDIGFGDILQNCVEPHLTLKPSGQNCYSSYESRQEIMQLIDRTVPRWTNLYKQLLSDNPAGRLYAIGYPSIVASDGKCGLNVHLSEPEIEFANQLVAYLDGSIKRAAQAAGVTYVDISHALDGHRLCEAASSSIAVNGLTAGNDVSFAGFGVLGHESYHPNALGQQLIEQSVLKQTDNLSMTDRAQPAATAPDGSALLDAPKSGAPVYALMPDDNITSAVIRPGLRAQLTVDGRSTGLGPNSSYSVSLGGPAGNVLKTVVSDDQGNISADFAVPPGAAAGGTTVDITGLNAIGQTTDVTQPVYIASTPSDFDGDGIANSDDSCPYAVNSGQDGDGVDDSCDDQIGSAASTSGPAGGNDDRGASASGGGGAIETSSGGMGAEAAVITTIKTAGTVIKPAASNATPSRTTKASGRAVLGATRQSALDNNHAKSSVGPSPAALQSTATHRPNSRHWRVIVAAIGVLIVIILLIFARRRHPEHI